mmetsp:Transcript_1107/g.2690  ORF Transcript_1107/g.2690 Transcript_1107/m.2690 type:complete len:216 (+) Transcript_1107:147-794(+)
MCNLQSSVCTALHSIIYQMLQHSRTYVFLSSERHDGIDQIPIVLFQRRHRLGTRTRRLTHDQIDILGLHAILAPELWNVLVVLLHHARHLRAPLPARGGGHCGLLLRHGRLGLRRGRAAAPGPPCSSLLGLAEDDVRVHPPPHVCEDVRAVDEEVSAATAGLEGDASDVGYRTHAEPGHHFASLLFVAVGDLSFLGVLPSGRRRSLFRLLRLRRL